MLLFLCLLISYIFIHQIYSFLGFFYCHHLWPFFIILVIIVCYPAYIITMKKLMNVDLLAFCHCHMYFVFVMLRFCCNLLTALESGSTTNPFNLICTVCKSPKIFWPTKIQELINIKCLAYYCHCLCFVSVLY